MSAWREALLLLTGDSVAIEPIPRGPLPPFDPDTTDPDTGAPLPVNKIIPYPVPKERNKIWWRGNFGAVTIPGLPWVEGGATGPAQDRCLTWFLDRWAVDWQHTILLTYAQRGYTHFTLSWPDSRIYGTSIAGYVDLARRVQSYGLWVDHHFFAKGIDPQNPDPSTVYPLIDALLGAGALDIGTVGWELNAFNDPDQIQRLIDGVCSRTVPAGIPTYLHFLPHYASWQENHEQPGDFWNRQIGKIQGLKYQCDPRWSAGMMQARVNDVLVRLIKGGLWGIPHTFDVVVWETVLMAQFNNAAGGTSPSGHYDEDYGDLIGYETLCSQGPMPVMGFGNGGRMPDGAII